MTAPLLLLLPQLFVSTIQMQRLVKVEISMELWAALDSRHGRPFSGVHVWITCWAARTWSVLASCVNEKNVLSPWDNLGHPFLCVSVLCICRCVIHSHFLQSYLLLCNWLFSRRQTFLSQDTNVCRVVMDMLGILLLSLAPYCCCRCCFVC